jgi:signal transduction histidine kinase
MADGDDADRSLNAILNIQAIQPILEIVQAQTGMGFVAIAWVTRDRWKACAVLDRIGMGIAVGDELDADTTICKDVFDTREGIAFDDASTHPVYSRHRTPCIYGFRAYASYPIVLGDGKHFGNLCAIDSEPRDATSAKARAVIESCAAIVGRLLDGEAASSTTRRELADARLTGGAREQFLAVVAHDLRNPLSTMHTAAEVLLRGAEPKAARMGHRLKASAQRMTRLIDDLVDYAKGRAGSAITVVREPHADLSLVLEAVVDEARDANPGHAFTSVLEFEGTVVCDTARLQQLLSNLLGNAVAYGDRASRIVVEGYVSQGRAHLLVTNAGDVVPEDVLERVFEAFYRGVSEGGTSMGLGLSICMQIAQAHDGQLLATSSVEEGTRFALDFPVA